jgi:hypothetical protein
MLKPLFFSGLLVAFCVAVGESQAALVISFTPNAAPALGATFTDFDVKVTNSGGATVNVNAMKFNITLTGVNANISGGPDPFSFRTTNASLFAPDAPITFGIASNAQFLTQVSPTVIRINDSARLPTLLAPPAVNDRAIANGQSFIAAKIRVNFTMPGGITSPYSFTLDATALPGVGNELSGVTFGAYNGFGFASNPGGGNTMVDLGLTNTQFAFSITAVPEPSTFVLVGIAISAAAGGRLIWRKRSEKMA